MVITRNLRFDSGRSSGKKMNKTSLAELGIVAVPKGWINGSPSFSPTVPKVTCLPSGSL